MYVLTALAVCQADRTAGVRCCVTAPLSHIHPLNYAEKRVVAGNVYWMWRMLLIEFPKNFSKNYIQGHTARRPVVGQILCRSRAGRITCELNTQLYLLAMGEWQQAILWAVSAKLMASALQFSVLVQKAGKHLALITGYYSAIPQTHSLSHLETI